MDEQIVLFPFFFHSKTVFCNSTIRVVFTEASHGAIKEERVNACKQSQFTAFYSAANDIIRSRSFRLDRLSHRSSSRKKIEQR